MARGNKNKPKWCWLITIVFIIGNNCYAQNNSTFQRCPQSFEMHKNGGSQLLSYASTLPLTIKDTTIKRLLIYIHGIKRNGMDYFAHAENMLLSANEIKTTLLIAPQYPDLTDLTSHELSKGFLFWKKAEWKDGYESIKTAKGGAVSSYEVLDSIIARVLNSNNFPNLKTIIVAGHSAGGQFVQRYSAITPLPDQFTGYKFRFLVMDPSSYMYPDGKRPVAKKTYLQPNVNDCPEYDLYPKGLNNLNTYAQAIGSSIILHNIFSRAIFVLLGENDTNTEDPNLDVSCAANLQGPNRLERGIRYSEYLKQFPKYGAKTNYSIVGGTGHSSSKMINSSEAKNWIFAK